MKLKYLVYFVEEKIEIKERSEKENDFRKFFDFVQVMESYSQNMEMETYHFLIFISLCGELSLNKIQKKNVDLTYKFTWVD